MALQYALEPVLKELGTEELLQSTYVVQEQVTKDDINGFLVSDVVKQRINQQLEQFYTRIKAKELKEEPRWEKIV